MISTVVMIAIAAAALLGSAVGSFIEARIWAVVWSTPVVAVLGGLIMLVAPYVETNETLPMWLREAAPDLAQPALVIQALIACAVGALVSSAAVRYVQRSHQKPVWLPSMDEGGRFVRPGAATPPRPAQSATDRRLRQIEGLEAMARTPRVRTANPQTVFEVADVGSAAERLAPRPARAAAPPPSPESNKRIQPRRRSLLSGLLVLGGGVTVACTIQNLSVGGAQVKLAYPVAVPSRFWLIDVSHGLAHHAEPAWREGAGMGLKFLSSVDLKVAQSGEAEGLRRHWLELAPR